MLLLLLVIVLLLAVLRLLPGVGPLLHLELVRVELDLDVDGVAHPVQHLGRLVVVGHPQVDATHLEQLVAHLKSRLACQAVRRDGGDENTSGAAGAGGSPHRPLLDHDPKVFAGLLDVDLADLSMGGLVRLAREGKGQTTRAARGKHLREALTGRTSMNSIQFCEIQCGEFLIQPQICKNTGIIWALYKHYIFKRIYTCGFSTLEISMLCRFLLEMANEEDLDGLSMV